MGRQARQVEEAEVAQKKLQKPFTALAKQVVRENPGVVIAGSLALYVFIENKTYVDNQGKLSLPEGIGEAWLKRPIGDVDVFYTTPPKGVIEVREPIRHALNLPETISIDPLPGLTPAHGKSGNAPIIHPFYALSHRALLAVSHHEALREKRLRDLTLLSDLISWAAEHHYENLRQAFLSVVENVLLSYGELYILLEAISNLPAPFSTFLKEAQHSYSSTTSSPMGAGWSGGCW